jgi:hypothetical protein
MKKSPVVALSLAAALQFAAGAATAQEAPETRTFAGLTPEIFECLKSRSEARDGTVYEPRDADAGRATTSSLLWQVVIDYVFTPATGELQYTLVSKTRIIPIDAIWNGIDNLIAACAAG